MNQKEVNAFCVQHGLSLSPEYRALDLVSEVGEVSKEILMRTNYGTESPVDRPEIKEELGDVYFSLFVLANALNVDLEEALQIVLKKYEKRLQTGDPGSANA
ncbi:nucleotide pyrophosphohydrolase [Candidatus Uhrbacteria bacterium]|nr:nucleotide pyrophosphohydrolase [Candidatus Uhrbacteria bacterium]MBD3284124.1 nucleotide pyrophosphohydrolase [Candidatus Uhrbacteria bacterium]